MALELQSLSHRVLTTMLAMQRYSWEQGVAANAVHDVGRYDVLLAMANDAITRQSPSGQLAYLDEVSTVNSAANGEAVLWASRATGDPRYREAAQSQLYWLLEHAPRAPDGTLYHRSTDHQIWADTVYMVCPFLVSSGQSDAALGQIEGHRGRLFDESAGLYAAVWDEDRRVLYRPAFWGTGNGWVVAAIARIMPSLPRGPARDDLARHALRVIEAAMGFRRKDGLFHDVLNEPETFVETNFAQMLAYAIGCGVADGWLPFGYVGMAQSLRNAAAARVDNAGLVWGACGSPDFAHPGTSVEAQAFFLMAQAAAERITSTAG
ncbi:MAG: glycoside hydrolase family 88 protein [Micromonosporaceae bacterium]|nr:glycoside hydrolase family 88 protein [Micromonosporaceae bacterium]